MNVLPMMVKVDGLLEVKNGVSRDAWSFYYDALLNLKDVEGGLDTLPDTIRYFL